MKKIFIFVALLAFSSGAYAQNAELVITNHTQACSLFVRVFAIDPNLSDPNGCDIETCTIIVPPLTTVTYLNPSAVLSGPGLCVENVSFTAAALAAELSSPNPKWAWTDVTFQYKCIDPCGTGGNMDENFMASCTPIVYCHYPYSTTWFSPAIPPPITSCTAAYATWTSPGNCFMSDVTLDFN